MSNSTPIEGQVLEARRADLWPLVWLFGVIAVIGLVIVVVIMRLGSSVDTLQTDLDKARTDLRETQYQLQMGRYERTEFQIDQRRLTCIDLQDGDTGATDEQYAECAKDAIAPVPKPEEPKT